MNDVIIYVTFGSRVIPPPNLVRTVAEGLLEGGWAVVWSLKEEHASNLPPGKLYEKEQCQEEFWSVLILFVGNT